jgi:hypothetical protein
MLAEIINDNGYVMIFETTELVAIMQENPKAPITFLFKGNIKVSCVSLNMHSIHLLLQYLEKGAKDATI